MKPYLPALVLAMTSAASGCATHSISSDYVKPTAALPTKGVVYALPKTRLKVTVTYTVSTTTIYSNGVKSIAVPAVSIRAPVVVEALLVGDRDNMFVAKGDKLIDAATLDTTFKITLGSEQLLTGVSADTSDKSGEVLKNIVGSAISVAKILAVAGTGTSQTITKIQQAIDKIDASIAALADSTDGQRAAKIKALIEERKALVDFLGSLQEDNKSTTEDKQATYSTIVDVNSMTWDPATLVWTADVQAPPNLVGVANASAVPKVTLKIFATGDEHTRALTKYESLSATDREGILYRIPAYLHVQGEVVGQSTVLDGYLPIMQAGLVGTLEAKSKSFTKRNTSITFDGQTGALKEFGVVTESSAAASTKAISESLGSVQTAVADLKKAREDEKNAEKSDAQVETASLKEQTDLINAQFALIEAQQKLDAAKAPKQPAAP
jgi:hypothetical protein